MRFKIILCVLSLHLLKALSCSGATASTLPQLYNRLISQISDAHYKKVLRNKSSTKTLPDFLIASELDDRQYTFLSFTTGSHGSLFLIASEAEVHAFNLGLIQAVLTETALPFLKKDEALVITSTGGTGEHQV